MYNEINERNLENIVNNSEELEVVKGNLSEPISVATVPPTAYGTGDIDEDYQ